MAGFTVTPLDMYGIMIGSKAIRELERRVAADTIKLKRMINHCHDPRALSEIIKAATDRRTLLYKQQHQQAVAETWAWASKLAAGTTLYCCAAGVFLGGLLQRGDQVTLYSIQPRAKRIWVLNNGKLYGFKPDGFHHYEFKTEPPDKSVSESVRRLAECMAEGWQEVKRKISEAQTEHTDRVNG